MSVAREAVVLFVGCNPPDTVRLDIGKELQIVRDVFEDSPARDLVRLEGLLERDLDAVSEDMLQHRPRAVHVSAHGTEDGALILRDHDGASRARAVRHDTVARVLTSSYEPGDARPALAVLNVCHAAPLAKQLSAFFDCAVGLPGELHDRVAARFAQSLYRALAYGRSVQAAFDHASAMLLDEELGPDERPVLHVRNGLDARDVRLVMVAPDARAPGVESKPSVARVEAPAPPTWREMLLGVVLRPAWLHERLQATAPEVFTLPFFAAMNTRAVPAAYRAAMTRFVAAVAAGVVGMAACFSVLGWVFTRVSYVALDAAVGLDFAQPGFGGRGLALGLAVGGVVGVVLGGAFGLSMGIATGVASGVSVGLRFGQYPVAVAAVAWGSSLGLALALLPSLTRGRHLNGTAKLVVSALMAAAFYGAAGLWCGHWGAHREVTATARELRFATGLFFVVAASTALRWVVNLALNVVVECLWRMLDEADARARLVLFALRWSEHHHIPLTGFDATVAHLRAPDVDARLAREPGGSALRDALDDARRCPAYRGRALDDRAAPR